jgi:uncharacterized protein with PQ loop repeat
LVVLSFLSFIPQYCRILARRNVDGISAFYITINLILATEQLGIGAHQFILKLHKVDELPTSFGDAISLAQFVVVMIGHLLL